MTENPKTVIEEGQILKNQYVPKTEQEVKQFALDIIESRMFVSWMLRPHEADMLYLIFMPLALMDDIGWKRLEAEEITHFYAYMKDAGPRSINGLPIFFSMGLLTQGDTLRINKAIKKLLELRKQFLEDPT